MLWLSLGKLGLRSAARDIAIERENYRFCFPIVTWLVVSVARDKTLAITAKIW